MNQSGDGFEQVYEAYRHNNTVSQQMGESQDDNREHIVAVRKNDEGNIIAVRTNSGRELDYVAALAEAKSGSIAHVDVFHKYGRDILRSEPDGIKENNLDNLPTF